MRLDDDMRRVVREQSLGFVATVCPDGTPNLSPKGTTIVWDDEHLVFLHLYSPGTVANLAVNPSIEINVVDPLVRKGYRCTRRCSTTSSSSGAQTSSVCVRSCSCALGRPHHSSRRRTT